MCAIEHDEDAAVCQLVCQVKLLAFRTTLHSNLIILTLEQKVPEVEILDTEGTL